MGLKNEDLYLGHILDEATSEPSGSAMELPSHRLTTHGVIVGMTGSGKTGLGVVLLEEVLARGVPTLILDPKGDMGNLLLNFPKLRAGDFKPWVDSGEAGRRGVGIQELAEETAQRWADGLRASGIGSDEMTALKDRVDMRILTPGSSAGLSLNIIGDLSPPDLDWDTEGEVIRDEIEGLVSGILVMADIEPDPLTSKEHILLSNLVENAWKARQLLDLPGLIGQVQQPPIRKLGVFDLDSFFPERERTRLAMRLNGLMASPSFADWMRGAPLEMDSLLRAPDGRPRASIVYLSHLSETERVFVVTLLLSKLVTWMRRQPGTSELRALVYADEVMGLAPPTAEPPSKRPILTLFKQARAHGVGVVLATQNPMDLDYKLMSNAGTWMVGRLQTERDKARIIEAMRSASGDIDVSSWDARISALGKREFVLKTARSPDPELFTTRWAMSFLRGPLTRAELVRLREEGGWNPTAVAGAEPAPQVSTRPLAEEEEPSGSQAPSPGSSPRGVPFPGKDLAEDETPVLPAVASGISVRYLDPSAPWVGKLNVASGGRRLEPGLAVRIRVLFDDRRGDLRHEDEWEAVLFPLGGRLQPEDALKVDHDPRDFRREPPPDAVFALTGIDLADPSFFTSAERELEEHLHRGLSLTLYRNQELGLYSRVGESEEDFRHRCMEAAEDGADEDTGKLRDRYETRMKTAQRRVADAERRVRELEVDTQQRQQQELLSGAGEVLSMFLGGRRRTRSLAGISSRRSQTRRTQERLRSAEEKLEDYREDFQELEDDLRDDLRDIWDRWQEKASKVEAFEVGLERTDVSLEEMTLFWAPVA